MFYIFQNLYFYIQFFFRFFLFKYFFAKLLACFIESDEISIPVTSWLFLANSSDIVPKPQPISKHLEFFLQLSKTKSVLDLIEIF